MDIEKEMLTSDGLGAAIKSELRDVKKDKGFKLFDDFGHEIEEGDEVHLEGYSNKEGRGVITHVGEVEPEDETHGYVMITVFFYTDDRDEYFKCYPKPLDWGHGEFVADEFELV